MKEKKCMRRTTVSELVNCLNSEKAKQSVLQRDLMIGNTQELSSKD